LLQAEKLESSPDPEAEDEVFEISEDEFKSSIATDDLQTRSIELYGDQWHSIDLNPTQPPAASDNAESIFLPVADDPVPVVEPLPELLPLDPISSPPAKSPTEPSIFLPVADDPIPAEATKDLTLHDPLSPAPSKVDADSLIFLPVADD